jgi:hypothetical protein
MKTKYLRWVSLNTLNRLATKGWRTVNRTVGEVALLVELIKGNKRLLVTVNR